jgi:hypothetical protein
MTQIPRQPIASSAIASAGYCAERGILDIEFRRDRTLYRYFDVPPDISRQLLDAPSVGRCFLTSIRDRYQFVRIPLGRLGSDHFAASPACPKRR